MPPHTHTIKTHVMTTHGGGASRVHFACVSPCRDSYKYIYQIQSSRNKKQPVIYHAYTDTSRPRKRHAKHAHTRHAACSQPHLKVRVLGSNAAEKTFALRAKLSLLGPQPITAELHRVSAVCVATHTHTHSQTREVCIQKASAYVEMHI